MHALRSTQRVSEIDVEVEMLRVLILAEVGQDACAAALSQNLRRDLFDNVENVDQQLIVSRFERQQRIDVTFRDDDDMNGPERARVMERQHVVGFDHFVDRGAPAERLLAIEILCHMPYFICRTAYE